MSEVIRNPIRVVSEAMLTVADQSNIDEADRAKLADAAKQLVLTRRELVIIHGESEEFTRNFRKPFEGGGYETAELQALAITRAEFIRRDMGLPVLAIQRYDYDAGMPVGFLSVKEPLRVSPLASVRVLEQLGVIGPGDSRNLTEQEQQELKELHASSNSILPDSDPVIDLISRRLLQIGPSVPQKGETTDFNYYTWRENDQTGESSNAWGFRDCEVFARMTSPSLGAGAFVALKYSIRPELAVNQGVGMQLRLVNAPHEYLALGALGRTIVGNPG